MVALRLADPRPARERKSFTAVYRTPIEKRGDRAKQRLLSVRIKSFLMRRTEEQVADDLPEKTVIDELIPLEGAQAALYESIRTAMDKRVREATAARGLPSRGRSLLPRMTISETNLCPERRVTTGPIVAIQDPSGAARHLQTSPDGARRCQTVPDFRSGCGVAMVLNLCWNEQSAISVFYNVL